MAIVRLADLILLAVAVPVAAASVYLMALALLSSRPRVVRYGPARLRFDVIIPAHDEEAGIAETLRSVDLVDYPQALRRTIVVADNCSDATAERARGAGALVLERTDPERRGKGYALAFAFERVLADGIADAVVVIDADTVVSRNLLQAFAARLEAGAPAVQANNVVGNPEAGWRTALLAVALVLMNTLRSVARDRLGVSTGLRGNGMCLSTRLLREVPHQAFSVVEDLEYGIRIARAGHRVRFAHEAKVASVMVTSAAAAASQRRRWEGGRLRLAREQGLALVWQGIAGRDAALVDLGLDLLVPPLAYLAGAAFAGALIAALGSLWSGHVLVALWAFTGSVAALAVYVARGWWMSGTGMRGLLGLLCGPVYLVWKLRLLVSRRQPHEWVRTAREQRR